MLVAVAILTGVLTPVQSAANAQLSRDATGSPVLSGAINTTIGTAMLLGMALGLFAFGALEWPTVSDFKLAPWWSWCGGLLGGLFVSSLAFLTPKLGVAPTMGLVVTSQLLTSLLVDHYGWFGVEPRPADPLRLTGAGVMIVGVALMQWPKA